MRGTISLYENTTLALKDMNCWTTSMGDLFIVLKVCVGPSLYYLNELIIEEWDINAAQILQINPHILNIKYFLLLQQLLYHSKRVKSAQLFYL